MENTKLTTPLGKPLEVKAYITAGERNRLRTIATDNIKISRSELDEIKESGKINNDTIGMGGQALDLWERTLIEATIVSYDGTPEAIVDRLLKEKPEEYDFVVAEASKLVDFQKAK